MTPLDRLVTVVATLIVAALSLPGDSRAAQGTLPLVGDSLSSNVGIPSADGIPVAGIDPMPVDLRTSIVAPAAPPPPGPRYRTRSPLARARGRTRRRGCIYARYSTKFQHSIEDQVRACRAWAEANDVDVDDRHVFEDRGKSGKTHRRAGLQAMLAAVERDEVDVVITFATSRLYRKMYQSLKFIDEEIVPRRKRAVFVAQNIDTDKTEFWKQLVMVFAMLDELQLQSQGSFVRAAHEGLLIKRWVHGTITYGYRGEAVDGAALTKLGKPRRRWEIDEDAARWVRQAFTWFVVEERSRVQIARLLTEAGAPLPPRCAGDRWTPLAVRLLLSNPRYVGDWSYGLTEGIWQAKKGYSRQFVREEPRFRHRREEFRLIDDVTFFRAQERLARWRGRGGRPSHRAAADAVPYLLKDVLWCPAHQCYLTTRGTGGHHLACAKCKREGGALFSHANRAVATRAFCDAVAELITGDDGLARQVVIECERAYADQQRPDPAELERAMRAREELTRQIQFVYSTPAGDEDDKAEKNAVLARLQGERRAARARVGLLEALLAAPVHAPDAAAVRAKLADLAGVLRRAAAPGAGAEAVSHARAALRLLVGERVPVTQQGESRAKRGWLRATLSIDLVGAVTGGNGGGAAPRVVELDLKAEDEALDALAARAWAMAQAPDALWSEVAERLGVGRNRVAKLLRHHAARHGLPLPPDGRKRRATMSRKHRVKPTYQAIADRAKALWDAGKLAYEIGVELGVDRNTVTQAIRHWHESRGLPAPDGRERRKSLDRKSAPYRPRGGGDGGNAVGGDVPDVGDERTDAA